MADELTDGARGEIVPHETEEEADAFALLARTIDPIARKRKEEIS